MQQRRCNEDTAKKYVTKMQQRKMQQRKIQITTKKDVTKKIATIQISLEALSHYLFWILLEFVNQFMDTDFNFNFT